MSASTTQASALAWIPSHLGHSVVQQQRARPSAPGVMPSPSGSNTYLPGWATTNPSWLPATAMPRGTILRQRVVLVHPDRGLRAAGLGRAFEDHPRLVVGPREADVADPPRRLRRAEVAELWCARRIRRGVNSSTAEDGPIPPKSVWSPRSTIEPLAVWADDTLSRGSAGSTGSSRSCASSCAVPRTSTADLLGDLRTGRRSQLVVLHDTVRVDRRRELRAGTGCRCGVGLQHQRARRVRAGHDELVATAEPDREAVRLQLQTCVGRSPRSTSVGVAPVGSSPLASRRPPAMRRSCRRADAGKP